MSLILFFILTFIISWSIWILAAIYVPSIEVLILMGAWGPTISAIITSRLIGGKEELKLLLKQLTIWKVNIRYYLFAVYGILFVGVLAVGLTYLLTGNAPSIDSIVSGLGLEPDDGALILLLAPVLFLINTIVGGPIAEEMGWRGFAQSKLSIKTGPLVAGFVIGFVWAIWHLPLFYFFPNAVAGLPLLEYIILLTSMGVLFSWLHLNTSGSLFLAIIFHGGFNFTIGLLGAEALKDIFLLRVFLMLIILTVLYFSFLISKQMELRHYDDNKGLNLG